MTTCTSSPKVTSHADLVEWIWTAEALRTNALLTPKMREAGESALARYREHDAEFVDAALAEMPKPCPVCGYRPFMVAESGGHKINACCGVIGDLWHTNKVALARDWNELVSRLTPEAIAKAVECDPTRVPGYRMRHVIQGRILRGRL